MKSRQRHPKPATWHPIKRYRKSLGLTQVACAKLLGCSQPLIARVENERLPLSRRMAESWESITGIPRLSLLYPHEHPYPPAEPAAKVEQAAA